MIKIYTDGSCIENPGRGGWAAIIFINGKKTGVWVGYYYNGQLEYKGSFKNGKKEGIWEFYSSNGMKYNEFSGIYKNGNKISKAL